MESMLFAAPGKRMISLLTILEEITHSTEYQQLASKSFFYNSSAHDDSRLKAIYEFTFSNYKRTINLEELAALTHLTRQSFCRFFKETNRKTYYQFLMEVRIGHACRYLIEDQLPVTDIAWRCGYHNMANFIRQFKKITGQSPLQYRKQMRLTLLS
jgi:AraC-like DNA-binding protein